MIPLHNLIMQQCQPLQSELPDPIELIRYFHIALIIPPVPSVLLFPTFWVCASPSLPQNRQHRVGVSVFLILPTG